MKKDFGIRFVLATALSLMLATALLYFNQSHQNQLDLLGDKLFNISNNLSTILIVLGYYIGLNPILKTRVNPDTYLIYAGFGIIIGLVAVQQTFVFVNELLEFWTIPWKGLIWNFILPLVIAFLPPFWVYQFQVIKEHPTYRQIFGEGRGGSASWASVRTFGALKGRLKLTPFTYWLNKKGVTTDGIYLGRSMFSDDPFKRHVVLKEDGHNITIGLTGSGKSTTVQNLTYSMYEGSLIGFDPKGELSLATANRRNYQNIIKGKTEKHFPNGRVYVADPFGLNAEYGFEDFKYNPLAEIEPDLSNARKIVSDISDALFTPDDIHANPHFVENPRNIFEGFIIHVLSEYPKENHNLPFVYDLLRGINPETNRLDMDYYQKVLLQMSKNPACGGLAMETVRLLTKIGENERGSMESTMSRHLKWIGDEAMRKHLQQSDFRFKNFGIKKITIDGKEQNLIETLYIVLPDPQIDEFMRYVRLMFIMSARLMQTRSKKEKPKIPTLLIIDELPRLGGKIEVIAEGFGILRSYGIKLWCFVQTLGQLKNDYPKRWTSMIGNSTLQVFGVGMGDNETAEFVSKTLGSRIIKRYDRRKTALGFYKKVIISETARELLTPAEVTTKFGKSANVQVIFPNNGLPMRLERLAFKKLKFDKGTFKSFGLGGLGKQIEE